jgi:menaquinone-9 beta-reductase
VLLLFLISDVTNYKRARCGRFASSRAANFRGISGQRGLFALGLASVRVFSPSRNEFEIPGKLITIRRCVLDAILCRRAVACGAVAAHAQVDSIEEQETGVLLRSEGLPGKQIRAGAAIVATGADLKLFRRSEGPLPGTSAVAMQCYVQSRFELEEMIATYDRTILPGYAWIFPLGDGLYNVGCGVFFQGRRRQPLNLRTAFGGFIGSFPLAKELMAGADSVSPLRGARLRCSLHGLPPIVGRRILCAGEAVGTTFAYSGEGISKALESGQAAAGALSRALKGGDFTELSAYREYLDSQRALYRGHQRAEAWLRFPWLNDFMSARVRASKRLRSCLARVVDGEADPRHVFSVAGILRSLWGGR